MQRRRIVGRIPDDPAVSRQQFPECQHDFHMPPVSGQSADRAPQNLRHHPHQRIRQIPHDAFRIVVLQAVHPAEDHLKQPFQFVPLRPGGTAGRRTQRIFGEHLLIRGIDERSVRKEEQRLGIAGIRDAVDLSRPDSHDIALRKAILPEVDADTAASAGHQPEHIEIVAVGISDRLSRRPGSDLLDEYPEIGTLGRLVQGDGGGFRIHSASNMVPPVSSRNRKAARNSMPSTATKVPMHPHR